jgi:hypothetical protein
VDGSEWTVHGDEIGDLDIFGRGHLLVWGCLGWILTEVFAKSPAAVLEDALQAALHDSDWKSQSADQAGDFSHNSRFPRHGRNMSKLWAPAFLKNQIYQQISTDTLSTGLVPNCHQANLALRRMAIKAQAAGMHSLLAGNKEADVSKPELP